jgi:putative redox protein
MDNTIRVASIENDRFEVLVRGHTITVDQPVEDGGDDTAPTPTELFVSSLAACVAFYARRYLARHDLPTAGLAVDVEFQMSSRPARVGDIDIRLRIPDGVPEQNRAGLLAVASHCTVHNSLSQPPTVHIDLDHRQTQAA